MPCVKKRVARERPQGGDGDLWVGEVGVDRLRFAFKKCLEIFGSVGTGIDMFVDFDYRQLLDCILLCSNLQGWQGLRIWERERGSLTLAASAPYSECVLIMTARKSAAPQLCRAFATARAPTSSTSEKRSVSMMMGLGLLRLGVREAAGGGGDAEWAQWRQYVVRVKMLMSRCFDILVSSGIGLSGCS